MVAPLFAAGNALLLYHTSDWLPHAYIASAAMSIGAAWLYSKARTVPQPPVGTAFGCPGLRLGFGLTDAAWPAFVLLAFYSVAIAFLIARFGYAWIRRIGGCAVPFSRQAAATDRDIIDEFLWQELGDAAWVMVAIVDIGVDCRGRG